MRILLSCLLLVFVFVACRSRPTPFDSRVNHSQSPTPKSRQTTEPSPGDPIITIGGPARAHVATVNQGGRFVVLRFPIGAMPAVDRRFGVYREGMKVGELRVSGPQYDNNTVADIVAGECRVGDEARAE
jgi:hypothetical protein